jgi:hypothetical protein
MFWAVLSVLAVWLGSTWLFWIGYAGADDLRYAWYAYSFDRPPMNWWEFRIPQILAIRASFALLGPTEFASALPNLLASLGLLAAAGWMIGWPRDHRWNRQLVMLLAAMIPWDVGYRTTAGATPLAGCVFGMGAAVFLGRISAPCSPRLRYAGAVVMALSFVTHEIMLYPVGILCMVAVLTNFNEYWKPVLVCITSAALLTSTEFVAYGALLDDPLARLHTAAGGAGQSEIAPGGLKYFLWPLQLLFNLKPFAGSLGLVLAGGLLCLRRFSETERILFLSMAITWAWFGWGSMNPTQFKPLFHNTHYWGPVVIGVLGLLPGLTERLFGARPVMGKLVLAGLFALSFFANAVGGRWGQSVETADALLQYAKTYPEQRFATNISTLDTMWALNGFVLPGNVVCLNGRAVEDHLILNKQRQSAAKVRFSDGPIDGILLNLEAPELLAVEEQFLTFAREHPGRVIKVQSPQTKWLFKPLLGVLGERSFTKLTNGGEAVLFDSKVPVPQ